MDRYNNLKKEKVACTAFHPCSKPDLYLLYVVEAAVNLQISASSLRDPRPLCDIRPISTANDMSVLFGRQRLYSHSSMQICPQMAHMIAATVQADD